MITRALVHLVTSCSIPCDNPRDNPIMQNDTNLKIVLISASEQLVIRALFSNIKKVTYIEISVFDG